MKKFIALCVGLLTLGLFVGTAVFLYKKNQQKPVVYETLQPSKVDIVKKTVATGQIVPRKEIEIKSQASGVLQELAVQAGQLIKKGDLIAKIEIIPNMQVLSSAESQLERARLNLNNAQKEFDRQKNLFAQKLVPESEFTKYRLELDLQREAVVAAENNVALIKEGASKKAGKISNQVKATVEGMVLNVPVKEGAFIMAYSDFKDGTTIASIANMRDLIFEGKVDESEVGKIKEGMELVLNVGALGAEKYRANLEYISPKGVTDQGTVKFEIRAAITLPEGSFLRAGYSANADIVLAQRNQVLAINEGNLITENGQSFVEVMTAPQVFERRAVKVGISDGINIEILEGITASDTIKNMTPTPGGAAKSR
ncbi:MAG TPA: efflux RND transporter periplasmic adaptor subunit [Cellvibrionaceae bacterium]|nr:efflux RND transporter periplasmic adaptor subunit [Cellvibrionaceae bacterium]